MEGELMAGPNFTILRILAIILLCFAPFLLPPLAMALALGESAMVFAFAVTLGVWLFAALPGIVLTRAKAFNLTSRDGFLLVFATWAAVSLLGGLPYWLGGRAGFTDAILESVASFATTGGTTLGELDKLPHSLILWRSMSYWAGGMGIVVLTVALIPVLGVGGFQLVKAETPGPDKERLTSRLSDTAKILWLVYFIFTVILALLYLAGGMSFFDAVCQSMTVISTGGESTRGEAFAFYDSKFIDAVTVVFMLLTAINYNMYFRVLKGKWRDAVNSTEIKAFFAIFVCAAAVVTLAIIPVYG
jgi:trk system potassium uptake protein TrkH